MNRNVLLPSWAAAALTLVIVGAGTGGCAGDRVGDRGCGSPGAVDGGTCLGSDATIPVTWSLVARGFAFGCEAYNSPTTVELDATSAGGARAVAQAPCASGAALLAVAPGSYTVTATLR